MRPSTRLDHRVHGRLLGREAVLPILLPLVPRWFAPSGIVLALSTLISLKGRSILLLKVAAPTAGSGSLAGIAIARDVRVIPLSSLISGMASLILAERLPWIWSVGNGTWDVLWRIINVQFLVNGLRYRLDFRSKFLFDSVKVEAVVPVDQVDRQAKMAIPT